MINLPIRDIHMSDVPTIARKLKVLLDGKELEHACALVFGVDGELIDAAVVSIGNDVSCTLDPKVVLRWVLTRDRMPGSLLLAHNHPGGNHEPSEQDLMITGRFLDVCTALNVHLIDHLVIGDIAWSLRLSCPANDLGIVSPDPVRAMQRAMMAAALVNDFGR
jgi:DNA repair protein RadC